MKITIIGSGNAGCAQAFKFAEKGHQISLVKTSHTLHEENFDEIKKAGGIWGIDQTENNKKSFQQLYLITRDVEEGLSDAELIVVLTQSLQHQDIAKLISPHISDTTKMLLVIPGNLGSLFFRKELKGKDIILAEGESTPFDARIIAPGVVNILYKNARNALAFLPNARKEIGLNIASTLVDTYKYYRNNIVESALHNPNLVVHTIGVIMSANRIEMMNGEFWMYRESFSPSIWNLIEALDSEKNKIISLFKGEEMSYLDACKFRNELDLSKDSLEVFNGYAATGGPKGPASLNTRYLYEDVSVGLCLLSLLGKEYGVPTPTADALITIASNLVKYDFQKHARTFVDFGIDNMGKDELIEFVNS